jgi:predicted XRE-type DNA-binding protein
MTRRILTHEQETKYIHWIRQGDMTQQQAAQRAGVTEPTISNMMKRYQEHSEREVMPMQ